MGSYREDCIEAKAVREGIIEQRPLRSRNAKPKPIVVENRTVQRKGWLAHDWRKYGSYRTVAEAEATMAQQARKYPFYEFRLRADPAP